VDTNRERCRPVTPSFHRFVAADATVVTAGSNPDGGSHVVWDVDPNEEMRLEVFSPPYLFKGPRPVIGAAPTQMHLQSVNSDQVSAISEHSLG
jgi:hypothetical protein